VLSLFQLRTDWKYRSERFDQAAKAYADSKLEIRQLLNSGTVSSDDFNRALHTFKAVGARVEAIPDKQFNRLKQKHLLKVRISQLVDQHPGSTIAIIRFRLWWDDTKRLLAKNSRFSPQSQTDQRPPEA
jgi:predicted transcriptional regulator